MYDRFQTLLDENGIKAIDVCRELEIPASTISTWKTGKYNLKNSTLQKIADYFNVSIAWLMGLSESRDGNSATAKIPILGVVTAGIPITATENIIGYEEIPAQLARSGDFFGLKIRGESMSPVILNGDIVIVRKQSTANTGDIVIALVNGEDATCKKLIKRQDGIVLKSLNEEYGNFTYSNKQIEQIPVSIIGKVEQLRRNF